MEKLLNGTDTNWLKLRDTVVVGTKWRYEYEQLQYHYGDQSQRQHILEQYTF